MRKILKTFFIFFFAVVVPASLGVCLFEAYVQLTDVSAKDFWWQYPRKPMPISHRAVATTQTLQPISSQPSFMDYQGVAPWESRGRLGEDQVFHIRSSKYGFYTDYPIDQFPPKEPREFRIIWVGGSGAQGHGASSNEHMMYKLLEKKLQASLADTGYKIRIINLALAGHEAHTISGVLRVFGHYVDPDMILSYNGANDISQFPNHQDILCGNYFAFSMQATEIMPDWIKSLGNYFPAIVYHYGFGNWVKRNFYQEKIFEEARNNCFRDLGADLNTHRRLKTMLYQDIDAPMLVDNFKAIKRDFCGIPIMIAWQAVHDGDRTLYDQWVTDFDSKTNPVAILNTPNSQDVAIRFANPEKRAIHFIFKKHGAARPTWEEVIAASKAYTQEGDYVHISTGIAYENALTISGRSESGFNINRILVGKDTLYYLPLPADQASPSADVVVDEGKNLKKGSVNYGFKPDTKPVVYFVVKHDGVLSHVFTAKEDADVKNEPLPDVYYAMETTENDPSKQVYLAYTEEEVNKMRRKNGVYQQFFQYSKTHLDQYLNRYWYFFNADKIANEIDYKTIPGMKYNSISVHLDDIGQEVVAGVIFKGLNPVVRELIHDPKRPRSCR